jgi:5-methylcytosine-specific restriction endonuclease McrA
MIRKACSICGRIALPGTNRCERHYRKPRSGTYTRDAKRIVDSAAVCHLCGQGTRPGDPFVADHIIPRALGGPDTLDNLAPAHRSCNGRKSAKLAGHWPSIA